VPTPKGPIKIAWQQVDGTLRLSFEAPNGTSGRFVAPLGASEEALVDGEAMQLVAVGPSELGLSGLTPGVHTVEIRLPG
jgi:hypothetical protein